MIKKQTQKAGSDGAQLHKMFKTDNDFIELFS